MTATGELTTQLLEQVLQNFRKTAEAGLKAQQALMQQWTGQQGPAGQPGTLPEFPGLQTWDRVPQECGKLAADMLKKQQDLLNAQYKANMETLQRAMRVSQATDPDDFRQRCVDLCKTSLDCWCDSVQIQLKEFQGATGRLLELVATTPVTKA